MDFTGLVGPECNRPNDPLPVNHLFCHSHNPVSCNPIQWISIMLPIDTAGIIQDTPINPVGSANPNRVSISQNRKAFMIVISLRWIPWVQLVIFNFIPAVHFAHFIHGERHPFPLRFTYAPIQATESSSPIDYPIIIITNGNIKGDVLLRDSNR